MKNYKTKNLELAVRYPFVDVDSEANKKAIKEMFLKAMDGDAGAQATLLKYTNEFLSSVTKAENGRPLGDSIYKYSGPQVMPNDPAKIMVNDITTDGSLQLDTAWQSFYEFVNVSGTQSAEIIDIFSKTNGWANYASGDKLKLSSFGDADFAQVKNARHGVGYAMLRLWIEQDQWWNVNRVIQKIMLDNQRYKAGMAYTAIAGLAATADVTTCAGTTLDNRVDAFNAAYVTLLRRLETSIPDLTANRTVYVLSAPENIAIVNQVMNRASGSETNNIVKAWPMQVLSTFNNNISDEPESSKLGVYMFVPGVKNKWITFGSLMTSQKSEFTTDSVELYAQEYFNHTETDDQMQIVRLEA